MKSNFRNIIVLVVNIFVSLFYLAILIFIINKFYGFSKIFDVLVMVVKNKNLAIILITFCLVGPLAFILKAINKRL